jgi:hypothetical protein
MGCVDTDNGPTTPTSEAITAVAVSVVPCMTHGFDPDAGLLCIGQAAFAPWSHVHSTACVLEGVIQNAIGTAATLAT